MRNRIIIVDDDPINNHMSSYFISKTLTETDIISFELPIEALEFLNDASIMKDESYMNVILLDINMPAISGWDVLDEFEKMTPHIHEHFKIFLVSSSIDPKDRERSDANIFVKELLSKPLTDSVIRKLFTA